MLPARAMDSIGGPDSIAARVNDLSTGVPSLVELRADGAERAHPLPEGDNLIGRDADAPIRVDHPDVSRRHARIKVDGERILLEDLGSKNGVFIDEQRVDGTAALSHGDRLEIGGLVLELRHPAQHVVQVLAAAGEPTITRHRPVEETSQVAKPPGLLLPVMGILIFGLLTAALVAFG
jgi:hypothetical protein